MLNLYDIIEVLSPLTAFIGCAIRIQRKGLDKLNGVAYFSFPIISYLQGYCVFLQLNHRNNINAYTFTHGLILLSFCLITYFLIKEKLRLFFGLILSLYIFLYFFEKRNFDAWHSLNGPLSAWFVYSLVLCGLVVMTYLIKGDMFILPNYKQFSFWFSTSLVLYYTGVFLFYISSDLIIYFDMALFDTLWNINTIGLFIFFFLIGIGFTRTDTSSYRH